MANRTRAQINLRTWRTTARGISENAGWVMIRGHRRWVNLVAKCTAWDGSSQRRAWTVTAYQSLPHSPGVKIRAEASHHGLRWEAAELALQALQIELEKDEHHASC